MKSWEDRHAREQKHDMHCREGKKLIHNAPYDVSVGIPRHFPSRFALHLSCNNAISTNIISLLFLYYFLCVLRNAGLRQTRAEFLRTEALANQTRQETRRRSRARSLQDFFSGDRHACIARVCTHHTQLPATPTSGHLQLAFESSMWLVTGANCVLAVVTAAAEWDLMVVAA